MAATTDARYLFGFTDRPIPDLPAGPLGQPVTEPFDAVPGLHTISAVLADPVDLSERDAAIAAAVHHDQVLGACLGGAVIPVRVGTVVAAGTALGDALDTDELAATFERITGRNQYELVVAARKERASSGADYLLKRRAALREPLADRVVASVTECTDRVVVMREADGTVKIAVLVSSPDELGQLTDAAGRHGTVEVSGPHPPYQFVTAPSASANDGS